MSLNSWAISDKAILWLCAEGLVVVADGEQAIVLAGQALKPGVLQSVGVLEFVDQDGAKARAVVLAQRFVRVEQFVAAQQQLGEIDHALAPALRVIRGIQ